MNRFLKRLILSISVALLLLHPENTAAQNLLPSGVGDYSSFAVDIEMGKGYVSGICAMVSDDRIIKATLFNEFGITAMEFEYDTVRKKVKLGYVIKMMNKWYIKRTLKKDLAQLMDRLEHGHTEYVNERRNIKYKFVPVKDSEQNSDADYETEE